MKKNIVNTIVLFIFIVNNTEAMVKLPDCPTGNTVIDSVCPELKLMSTESCTFVLLEPEKGFAFDALEIFDNEERYLHFISPNRRADSNDVVLPDSTQLILTGKAIMNIGYDGFECSELLYLQGKVGTTVVWLPSFFLHFAREDFKTINDDAYNYINFIFEIYPQE